MSIAYLGIFLWSPFMICKMTMVVGNYINTAAYKFSMSLGDDMQVIQKILHSVNIFFKIFFHYYFSAVLSGFPAQTSR